MKVCRRCGKIDQSVNAAGFCVGCFISERQDYDNVRNYVRTHPNVTVIDAHMATGVSLKTIDRLIRDGDLSLKQTDNAPSDED